ncbi:MAG: CPBP family intramembrane glutamic endopeptidase [Anaerolineales bacterium]
MPKRNGNQDRQFQLFGLQLDARLTAALVVGTLLLMLDYYNRFLPAETVPGAMRAKAIERVFYYLVVPLAMILLFRDRPSDYGFQIGNWRSGLAWAGGSFVIAVPLLYLAARSPSMVAYYGASQRPLAEVIVVAGLDLIGWEFFFRGFLLFTLARLVGPNAILLQAVPFALAHLGKPQVETLTTVFGGAYFGWIGWRTRSFVYPFLLHYAVNVFVVLVAIQLAAQ